MTISSDNLGDNLLGLSPSAKLILEGGRKICKEEGRPFSRLDFNYKMAYGTFRNSISLLMKKGLVIATFKSKPRFYWVTDVPMPNALWTTTTKRGTGVGVRSRAALGLLELLERLAVGQRCVHDLRILFKAKGLYEALKCSSVVERIVPRSEDLQLRVVRLGSNRFARVTVHKNDSVSVVIAASLNPYPLSDEGIADLWSSLGKVSYFLEGCGAGSIPPVSLWVVTCWHFSRDSVAFAEVSGKGFEITVGEANAVLRAYLKRVGDRCYVRFEKLEEPKETLANFLSRKLEKG